MEDHLNHNTIASLDEMIPHDQVLEAYPWLTPQILNRWRRERAIRVFKGREGKPVYPRADLVIALNQETKCEDEQTEGSSSTAASGSERSREEPASIDTGTMTEADALREKLYLEQLSNRRKKSSSKSSGTEPPQRKPHLRSISSTS